MTEKLKALGQSKAKFDKLETFDTPEGVVIVTCATDEVTALCPVTGQPDWYQVSITYYPNKKCVESKTLKLYLQSFRNAGHFCENFAAIIAADIMKSLEPHSVVVNVTQKPRGGIGIKASAHLPVNGDSMLKTSGILN